MAVNTFGMEAILSIPQMRGETITG
jgi:hypothetical protein